MQSSRRQRAMVLLMGLDTAQAEVETEHWREAGRHGGESAQRRWLPADGHLYWPRRHRSRSASARATGATTQSASGELERTHRLGAVAAANRRLRRRARSYSIRTIAVREHELRRRNPALQRQPPAGPFAPQRSLL